MISGALREVIWRNKFTSIESKTCIYKTCVRPIMTNAAETRAATKKTEQLLSFSRHLVHGGVASYYAKIDSANHSLATLASSNGKSDRYAYSV
ncbi:hypothetical protein C0J52_24219 [Blattella germanica]|nr:hypothetical protein C0J52_24219 [Blattella germanica]